MPWPEQLPVVLKHSIMHWCLKFTVPNSYVSSLLENKKKIENKNKLGYLFIFYLLFYQIFNKFSMTMFYCTAMCKAILYVKS